MGPLYHPQQAAIAAPGPLPAAQTGIRTVVCEPAAPSSHRYMLDITLSPGPLLLIIQKNPSTADAAQSDPTVRAVERWARRNGFGRLLFANLFAWRSPHPTALNGCAWRDAVGPENDAWLLRAAQRLRADGDRTVAAWGNPNGIDAEIYGRRIREVLSLLAHQPLWRVDRLTRQGRPRHGLWWRADAPLEPWQPHPPAPLP
jgi:hypothetical protein